jgi:hypothetical protein
MSDPSRELGTADVGVLFVHGIGEQQRADTLVQFGEAIKSWLERWLVESSVNVTITYANLNESADETPAHARLSITGVQINSTWLLAESWWAASFQAPRYSDLWRWSLGIVPLAVADHFVRRFRLAQGRWRQLVELLLAGVAIALLPFMMLVMMASLVIGILPIPRLRTALLRLQKVLLGTVGDSYTLLESSIRGAAMSSRVRHDLQWLHASVAKSVVVAHSQGAAVAHAALKPANAVKPDLFFTFGSGLRKLLVLDIVRGGNRLLIWLLSIGLLLASFGVWRIYRVIVDPTLRVSWYEVQGTDPHNVYGIDLTNLWGVDVTDWRWVTLLGALAGVVVGMIGRAGSFKDRLRNVGTLAVVWAGLGLWMGLAMAGGPSSGIATALILVGVGFFTIGLVALVRKDSDMEIEQRLELGSRVTWIDRYARADPVPNGPMLSQPAAFVTSAPVSNLGSPLLDHSAYWRNQDQFVPAVALAIAEVAGLDLKRRRWDAERLLWAESRRKWRVAWLAVSRVAAAVVAAAIILRFREGLWTMPSDLPEPLRTLFGELIDLIDDVPFLRLVSGARVQSAATQALWVASVFLTMWVVYKLFEAVWSWWDHAETRSLFRRSDYTLIPLPFTVLLVVLSTAVTISLVLMTFLDRSLMSIVAADVSVQAVLASGWKGVYNPVPGLYPASMAALTASGLAGWGAKAARDWWMWRPSPPDDLDTWRGGAGFALVTMPVVAPAAWWFFGTGTVPISQLRLLALIAVAAIPGLLTAAIWLAVLNTSSAQRFVDALKGVTASGPFGCWLARVSGRLPHVTDASLHEYAREMLWRISIRDASQQKEGRIPIDQERGYGAEATSLAAAIAVSDDEDGREVVEALARRFPYAALAASRAARDRDPALARRLLVWHVESSPPFARKRIRRLLETIREPEDAPVVGSVATGDILAEASAGGLGTDQALRTDQGPTTKHQGPDSLVS